MIYRLSYKGRASLILPDVPVTSEFIGTLLTDGNVEGWKLVTCIGFHIDGQIFQMFFLADDALPLNALATATLRGIGDDSTVHGDAVILSRDDLLEDNEMSAFDEKWGNA